MLLIDIWCVGYCIKIDDIYNTAIGCIIETTYPDKEVKIMDFAGFIGEGHNKPRSDTYAAIAALGIITDEYKKLATVTMHAPSHYVRRMFVKKSNGDWAMVAVKNLDLIARMRSLISAYSDIKAIATHQSEKRFKLCVGLARDALNNERN
jgi:hypothetical protein